MEANTYISRSVNIFILQNIGRKKAMKQLRLTPFADKWNTNSIATIVKHLSGNMLALDGFSNYWWKRNGEIVIKILKMIYK
jgi:hypothetical protein